MVFQDYALFPHLTVGQNVGFGLARIAADERSSRVDELLATVGLSRQGDKYPHELSGGQQQRVALARALAPRPQLILLDEPFSNLDVDLRERLSLEVRNILKSQGITAVLVTHDQHEAFAMADEIGVMAEGRIQQWDTPYNLYHQPANRFVADFVGQGVFLPGIVLDNSKVEVELGVLESQIPLDCQQGCDTCGQRCGVEVLLRPDDIVHDDRSKLQAEVLHKSFRGADILYTLRLQSGAEVLSLVPSHHNHALGEKIGIKLDIDHVVAFKTSRSLRRTLRAGDYEVRLDSAFPAVIHACAETARPGQPGTWITREMQHAYHHLFKLGVAHSVEVWRDEQLIGGLYGLAIGRMFYGESMFARVTDASKIAAAHLARFLETQGFGMIDCQMKTAHLASLGAREIPREDFIARLQMLTVIDAQPGHWPSNGASQTWRQE